MVFTIPLDPSAGLVGQVHDMRVRSSPQRRDIAVKDQDEGNDWNDVSEKEGCCGQRHPN